MFNISFDAHRWVPSGPCHRRQASIFSRIDRVVIVKKQPVCEFTRPLLGRGLSIAVRSNQLLRARNSSTPSIPPSGERFTKPPRFRISGPDRVRNTSLAPEACPNEAFPEKSSKRFCLAWRMSSESFRFS